jgi:hypothetical protein
LRSLETQKQFKYSSIEISAFLQQEAVVIILDVGLSMTKEKKATSLLEAAVKAVSLLVQQKVVISLFLSISISKF